VPIVCAESSDAEIVTAAGASILYGEQTAQALAQADNESRQLLTFE
jgi:hypothetical protein